MSWLKDIADKLAANLREAGWPSSSDPVVNPEGKIPEPRRFSTTGVDLARPNSDATVLTPNTTDKPYTPFVRSPLQVREGGQTQNINMPEQDPGLAGVSARIEARVAQREANDATARRNKAMEDAARAAAAAFDAGIEAERNPVKLDSDRKLKAI